MADCLTSSTLFWHLNSYAVEIWPAAPWAPTSSWRHGWNKPVELLFNNHQTCLTCSAAAGERFDQREKCQKFHSMAIISSGKFFSAAHYTLCSTKYILYFSTVYCYALTALSSMHSIDSTWNWRAMQAVCNIDLACHLDLTVLCTMLNFIKLENSTTLLPANLTCWIFHLTTNFAELWHTVH